MPRIARATVGGYCYHVLNQGNACATVFHDPADSAAFVRLLRQACVRQPPRVLAHCLMPNHIQLVLRPEQDQDLAAWRYGLLTTHVSHYRRRYHSTGHEWQFETQYDFNSPPQLTTRRQCFQGATGELATRNSNNRTTEFTYDGSNHILTRTAVLPGTTVQWTQYVYDTAAGQLGSQISSKDLLTVVGHPNRTTGLPDLNDTTLIESYAYNGVGQQMSARFDRNGTQHDYHYDVVGRLLDDVATPFPGTAVDSAVRRLERSYDTAGRPYLFTSYDQSGGVVNEVRQDFNGFGQLVTEYQAHDGTVNTGTTPKVQYGYSYDPSAASGPNHSRPAKFIYPLSTPYPSGRTFTYGYNTGLDNQVSRPSAINEGATTLEGFTYLGLNTVVERTHPQPNVHLTYIDPAGGSGDAGDKYIGLDRFDRIVDVHWRNPSTATTTDRFGHGYDPNGNRLYRDNLHPDQAAATFDELYHLNGVNQGYDGFNQLLAFARGTLNETKDTIASPTRSQKWTANKRCQEPLSGLGGRPRGRKVASRSRR